jgi:ABC-type branched-subunit amino acid transport system substrate-binding protein
MVASICITCEEDDSGDELGTITIPVLVPTTGGLGAQGQAWEYALLLAQKEINDSGGVLGKELFLDIRDSQTDPTVGVKLAQDFFEKYDVRFLIHSDGSDSALAVAQEVTLPNNALILATVAGTTAFTTIEENTDLCFRSVVGSDLSGRAAAALAESDQHTNVAVYAEEHPYTQSLAASFVAYIKETGGTITAEVNCPISPPEDYDYASDLKTLESSNPDGIYLATYPSAGMNFLKTWGAQGNFTGGWYLDAILNTTDLFDTLVGTDLEGIRGITAMGNPTALKAMQAAMKAQFGEGADLTVSRLGENYDAVYLLALAIAKAGSTDTVAVRDALRTIATPPGTVVGPGEFRTALDLIAAGEDINYEGASGSVDFDEYGNVSAVFENWEVQNRTFVGISTWTP